MTKFNKKMVIAVGLVSLFTSFVSAKAKKQNSKVDDFSGHKAKIVRIAIVGSGDRASEADMLTFAVKQGFIQKELDAISVKYEFAFLGGGPAINEALVSKNIDIACYGDLPVILAKANGIDTKIISFGDPTIPGALVAGKNTKYKSVKDLAGKTIAYRKATYIQKVLGNILEDSGLTFDDIEGVESSSYSDLLFTGKVDATILGTTQIYPALQEGFNVVVDPRGNPRYNATQIHVARTQFLKDNPDIIKAFEVGLVRARKYVIANPDALRKLWVEEDNPPEAYDWLFPNKDNYYPIRADDTAIENIKVTLQFLKDTESIDKSRTIDIESWIDSRFYDYAFSIVGE